MSDFVLKCPVCGSDSIIKENKEETKEFVDKKELWKFILAYTPHYGEETSMTCVKRSIDYMPACKDVVEVIRCDKCEHFNTDGYSGDSGWCDVYFCVSLKNHFCSRGSRKVNIDE